MEKRITFNQLVFIKKNRKNSKNEAPIYLRITVNGQQTEMSLHRRVDINLWDKASGTIIGNKKEVKAINDYLMSIKSSIYEHYKYLRETEKIVTPIAIKNAYFGIEKKGEGIIEIYKKHNDDINKLIDIDFSPSTIQRYETSLKHTQNFIKMYYKKDDVPVTDINHKFITDYEMYFKTVRKCSHNTAMKYIKNFKKIIRIAIANGIITKDPFANYKMKLTKVERDFLNEEELNRLINLKINIERLEQVRDAFLFSCFTGLAYSDLKRLTPQHISMGGDRNLWIMINRKKTNGASHIPVLPITAKLIDKYKNHPYCIEKNVLLPVLTNQKMNAYLKEIADLCRIPKNLTSHIARHTFATTVTLNNDVPIETVSKMLGHSSINMTKIIIRRKRGYSYIIKISCKLIL